MKASGLSGASIGPFCLIGRFVDVYQGRREEESNSVLHRRLLYSALVLKKRLSAVVSAVLRAMPGRNQLMAGKKGLRVSERLKAL